MTSLSSDIWNCLIAVFSRWQRWLSGGGIGGAIVMGVYLYERIFHKEMSNRAYISVFIIAFLVVAFFSAL